MVLKTDQAMMNLVSLLELERCLKPLGSIKVVEMVRKRSEPI